MSLAAHGATHPGRRATNEDSLLVDLELGLFIVADGMGGHNAGEVASSLAVEVMSRFIRTSADRSANRLAEALRFANDEILARAERETACAGMGTTVAAMLVSPAGVVIANVGDSRVYRWRAGQLTQLTTDDSWILKMQPDGPPLSAAEIDRHPMRHVLTEVVGIRSDLAPQASDVVVQAGDTFLLCSDGLHGALSADDLAGAFSAAADVGSTVSRLVQQAVDAGASDNVTAVIVRPQA